MNKEIRAKFTINFDADDIVAMARKHILETMGLDLDSSRFAPLACSKAIIELTPREIENFYRKKYEAAQGECKPAEELRMNELRSDLESRGLKLLVFGSVKGNQLVLTESIDLSTDCNSIIDFSKMPFVGDAEECLAKDGFFGNPPPKVDGFGEKIRYVPLIEFSQILSQWHKNPCGGTKLLELAHDRLTQIPSPSTRNIQELSYLSPLVGLYFYQAGKQSRIPH